MRILIIGGVAAGTSAAAKARRNNEDAEIILYEKDQDISYSGCGMPYYIGGHLSSVSDLTPRDPAFFKKKYNIDIYTRHEVLSIDATQQQLTVKNLATGECFNSAYDVLVIATGASPVIPPIAGIDQPHVFCLRNVQHVRNIKTFLDQEAPKSALILGSGFIGLEMCEAFSTLGIQTTIVEKQPHVTPALDSDMAVYVESYLQEHHIPVYTNATVQKISAHSVELTDGTTLPADIILLATGVRPNTSMAVQAGVQLGTTGAIAVNPNMQTNIPNIYACGDCIEEYSVITKRPLYRPLGSTANKTGRIAGDCITGGTLAFRGIAGTGIFRLFDLAIAQTGLTEAQAKAEGYIVAICHNIKPDKPQYMGGQEMTIKAIADKQSGRLLGVQIIGYEGVDKRIDVFATAITYHANVEDLFHLDLAYAPPFSTTKDPVMYTGMILDNQIHQGRKQLTADELDTLMQSNTPYTLIDARVSAQYDADHIPTARNIPHADFRTQVQDLQKDQLVITYCNKGVTGNATQNILLGKGFSNVYSVSGGHKQYKITHKK